MNATTGLPRRAAFKQAARKRAGLRTVSTYKAITWVAGSSAVFDPVELEPACGSGAAWDLAFSKDAAQKYIYLADGTNEVVRVVLRDTLQEVTNFGDGGRQPGQFYGVHSIATDSKGNIYTTETYRGQRVQKFLFRGVAPVAKKNQGPPWPAKR